MSDNREAWDQMRNDRKKKNQEIRQEMKKLKDELMTEEIRIETETQHRIETERSSTATEYTDKIKGEMDLFKDKERQIEDKYRVQEAIEKSKLKDDLNKKLEQLSADAGAANVNIEQKHQLKAKQELSSIRQKHKQQMDSLVDSVFNQTVDLEDKLRARERDLLTGGQPTQVSAPATATPVQQSPQLKLKSPSQQSPHGTKPDGKKGAPGGEKMPWAQSAWQGKPATKTDTKPTADKTVNQKKIVKKEDKKDHKKEDKKDHKKDDKKKTQPKNKP